MGREKGSCVSKASSEGKSSSSGQPPPPPPLPDALQRGTDEERMFRSEVLSGGPSGGTRRDKTRGGQRRGWGWGSS